MASGGNVLETATRRTEEGLRPADRAARSMRVRIAVSRPAIDTDAYLGSIPFSAGSEAFTSAAFGPFGATFR